MPNNMVISIVAIFIYILVLISIPFRIKKYGKRVKSENDISFWIREIMIFIFSLSICCLCLRFDFGIFSNIALCGCGDFGAYIASKELSATTNEEE